MDKEKGHRRVNSNVISKSIESAKGGSLQTDIKTVYKFQEILGGGQFGTVRVGFKKDFPAKKYAIKSISKKNVAQNELKELLNEVQILSSLDHPNIIKLVETYQDQYYLHIVTELCTGKDVFTHCVEKGSSLTEYDICSIIFKIVSAIQYLHENKIVHRDIKADNIMFESTEPDAQIKIIDFGLSKKYSAKQKMKIKRGTPYYVSPEVLNGAYDEKCDIWAIGVLSYLLLTGQLPFYIQSNKKTNDDKKNEEMLYEMIKTSQPSFSNRIWKHYSKKALNFVNSCLIKDPNARPSAKDLVEHSWFKSIIKEKQNPEHVTSEVLENLKNFSHGVYLKKMVLRFLINSLSSSELKRLQASFSAIDLNNNGSVSKSELQTAFKNAKIEISEEEMDKIFGDGEKDNISYSDFIAASIDQKELVDRQKLTEAFKYFDVDNNGYIDSKDINDALLRVGKQMKENEDIISIIEEVPTKAKSDKISFEEFLAVFDM